MRVLDLFSGIGGFSLGLERTGGFETVAFCEIDPFCRRVLAKHWPGVTQYDDVRRLTATRLGADGICVDVICGGFPCQDISVAGRGAGLDGERSGLWAEFARIIGEVRPRFVIVENVAALLYRGLDRVLADLAALGFDAEWHCIPASAVGAPHRRDRLWIVADAGRRRCGQQNGGQVQQPRRTEIVGGSETVPDASRDALWQQPRRRNGARRAGAAFAGNDGEAQPLADADSGDGHGRRGALQMGWGRFAREIADNGHAGRTQWGAEPNVGRVAHGVPDRVDRLCALGNAVVPQIPEMIGRAILAAIADIA
jgi:DNA (cytosine-5)-methyltransferase 1